MGVESNSSSFPFLCEKGGCAGIVLYSKKILGGEDVSEVELYESELGRFAPDPVGWLAGEGS
jgi:hypothetical protein